MECSGGGRDLVAQGRVSRFQRFEQINGDKKRSRTEEGGAQKMPAIEFPGMLALGCRGFARRGRAVIWAKQVVLHRDLGASGEEESQVLSCLQSAVISSHIHSKTPDAGLSGKHNELNASRVSAANLHFGAH